MDINIKDIIAKISGDEGLLKKFQSNPTETIKSLINIDLPEEQVKELVRGVSSKIQIDSAGDLLAKGKQLFGK